MPSQTINEREIAEKCKSWAFQEARKLLKRLGGKCPEKGFVLFETGFGASGLPHIGTFGEVVRTTMVRQAFTRLCDFPTKLYVFSDDMDALRKVPTNLPSQEMLSEHLNVPLTSIPDPFGTHDSFAAHNNARLCAFLDDFGFEYEFQSSTEWYKEGRFDEALMQCLRKYNDIMAIMLPTLREERQKTYSPFLPISPTTGRMLQVPLTAVDATKGTVSFIDEDGAEVTVPVTGGHVKMQWKPDWAMRWHGFGVDYEMSGKDLAPSVQVSSKITRALGSRAPGGLIYELFLDDKGAKISKSKGNGLTADEWLRYAPQESLSYFMYQKPQTAKRLFFDVIPKAVDEYLQHLQSFPQQELDKQMNNPVWHIHNGQPPFEEQHVNFSMLLNLASAANAHDKTVLWGFMNRYAPEATPEKNPILDDLVGHAVKYYEDFVLPTKAYRQPDDKERAALVDLRKALEEFDEKTAASDIQTAVYTAGKDHNFSILRDWFKALYEVLLGQSQGPRMGSFIKLYGIEESKNLVDSALKSDWAL